MMYEMRVVVKGLGKALPRVPDELKSLYSFISIQP